MIPYFALLVIIFICAILDLRKDRQLLKGNIHPFRILIYLLFAIFSGFRYKVGVDYENYVSTYNCDNGFSVNEPGFELLIEFLNGCGFTFQMMFLIMAVITQFFVYKSLNRLKHGFWLATLVYYCISTFYLSSFNGSRQYVAIAIILWALKFVYDKQFIFYLFSVIFAALFFHFSALIFIPLYFFLRLNNGVKSITILLLITFLASKVLNVIIGFTPYLLYVTRESDFAVHETIFIFAIISFFFAYFNSYFYLLSRDVVLLNMNLLCLCSLLLVLLQSSGILSQMMLRINSYFLFAYLLMIPRILYSFRPLFRYMLLSLVIMLSVAYLYRTVGMNGSHYVLTPYSMNFNII